jgi:hypothetical protein
VFKAFFHKNQGGSTLFSQSQTSLGGCKDPLCPQKTRTCSKKRENFYIVNEAASAP